MDSTKTSSGSVWPLFLGMTALVTAVIIALWKLLGEAEFWLPFPPNLSTHGGAVDQLFYVCLWITGITFILVEAGILAFLIHFRQQPGRRAVYLHGNHKLELIWTIIPTVILFVVVGWSIKVWADVRLDPPDPNDPNVVRMEVLAQQFQWNFRYPGPDGKFGKTDIQEVINDKLNVFGIEPDDEAGKDDIVAVGTMHIPKGRPVLVRLLSKDVLHSFFLPNLRVKMDAVPGTAGTLYFTAERAKLRLHELDANAAAELKEGPASEALKKALAGKGIQLTDDATLAREEGGPGWVIDDYGGAGTFIARVEDGGVGIWNDGRYDIVCAELCGKEHWTMRARLVVDETTEAFEAWLEQVGPWREETESP